MDSFGWNFRHAHFHEEGRRTLYKAFGIKFVIIVQGRAGKHERLLKSKLRNLNVAGKFDLKNTVINIVAGLGLLSFITMFCDFVLLNYVKERKIVSTNCQCSLFNSSNSHLNNPNRTGGKRSKLYRYRVFKRCIFVKL